MAEKKTGGKLTLAIVRPSVIATTFSGRSEKFAKQQRLNAIVAGVYALQAIVLWIIGRSATAPVSAGYLAKDPLQSAAQQRTIFMLAQHHLFDVSLLGLLVALLFGWAVFHGLQATAFRERYERGLITMLNDVRWAGAAVLGALLTIVVSLSLGISDIGLLFTVAALCVLISYGAMAIEANKKFWPWAIFAAAAGIGATLALGSYLVGGLLYGDPRPATLYGVALVPLLTGVAVCANLWLQLCGRGRWSNYLFAETVYIGIGFVATSLVAWLIFAGMLR
jgi:hypothetical protein